MLDVHGRSFGAGAAAHDRGRNGWRVVGVGGCPRRTSGSGRRRLLSGVTGFLLAVSTQGQWLTQEIPLASGWNALFLRVQPEPATCREVFAQLPVAAVYQWNGRDRTLQFSESPNQLLPRDDDWLFWLPPTHPQAPLNTLHTVHANQAYLVRVAAGVPAWT